MTATETETTAIPERLEVGTTVFAVEGRHGSGRIGEATVILHPAWMKGWALLSKKIGRPFRDIHPYEVLFTDRDEAIEALVAEAKDAKDASEMRARLVLTTPEQRLAAANVKRVDVLEMDQSRLVLLYTRLFPGSGVRQAVGHMTYQHLSNAILRLFPD